MRSLESRAPFVFELPASKVLSTIAFLKNILAKSSSYSSESINKIVGKVITNHPEILRLSITENLQPRIDFLRKRCYLEDGDLGAIIQGSSSAVLGLSVENNLSPTIAFLESRLYSTDLKRCIKSHPQLLGLSLSNLEAKAKYFDRIDRNQSNPRESLVSRVLRRSPEVFSLSLEGNILEKVNFLSKVWGVDCDLDHSNKSVAPSESRSDLASLLSEDPSVLTLSLEGNLRPTVSFYNRTGYVNLDENWRPSSGPRETKSVPVLRSRYLCASLYLRLLPRYHFYMSRPNHSNDTIPLYLLVSISDAAFCKLLEVDEEDYKVFKDEAVPRFRFSSQFDIWLKTGRPIVL